MDRVRAVQGEGNELQTLAHRILSSSTATLAGCQDSREAQAGDMDGSMQSVIVGLLARASMQGQYCYVVGSRALRLRVGVTDS